MFNNSRIIICGGGTGGHLFPAISIKTQLSNRGAQVLYMGSKHGIESIRMTKDKNTYFLDIKGIHRTLSISNIIENITFPFKVVTSIIKSLKIIYQYNPMIVIGTGGYSSGIPLISAIILRKKILLQEQNSYPGITTRILSRFSNKVCIAYNESTKYIKTNTIFSGNPIRSDFKIIKKNDAKAILNISKYKFTIFICGGSQGSKPINEHIINNLNYYNNLNANIIWQCGFNHYKKISKLNLNTNIKLFDFINKMDQVYSACDLVVSRSGALTLSEINFFGKASILIPFPSAAGNHQHKNALVSKHNNASILIKQNNLIKGELEKNIEKLINSPEDLYVMENGARSLSTPNSIDIILKEIQSLLC
mgnify:CR=1 FL=1